RSPWRQGPQGRGPGVHGSVVDVVLVVVGTQNVSSASQAARTCCRHCFRHALLAAPLRSSQPAAASHARISSMQFFRLHGGTALAVDATTPAASNGSGPVASVCLAVIANPPLWARAPGGLRGASSSTHYHESPREGEGTVAEQASARQQHRDSVNSAVCTDYAPGLRRGAPRDEPGDRRASLLVEGCGVRQSQDESRAAAWDDRVPLNRLTQLPRRCCCPLRS